MNIELHKHVAEVRTVIMNTPVDSIDFIELAVPKAVPFASYMEEAIINLGGICSDAYRDVSVYELELDECHCISSNGTYSFKVADKLTDKCYILPYIFVDSIYKINELENNKQPIYESRLLSRLRATDKSSFILNGFFSSRNISDMANLAFNNYVRKEFSIFHPDATNIRSYHTLTDRVHLDSDITLYKRSLPATGKLTSSKKPFNLSDRRYNLVTLNSIGFPRTHGSLDIDNYVTVKPGVPENGTFTLVNVNGAELTIGYYNTLRLVLDHDTKDNTFKFVDWKGETLEVSSQDIVLCVPIFNEKAVCSEGDKYTGITGLLDIESVIEHSPRLRFLVAAGIEQLESFIKE